MPMTEKAESVASKSSKKRKNRKKRDRQWSCYVDNLKNTIDCMYEMCRSEQSVAGCREAMLYLERANNDFKSLIETINVEKEWTTLEPEKRQSVAWEIRKSMSSPNPVTITDKPLLPISSMIAEAVRHTTEGTSSSKQNNLTAQNLTYARITAAAAVAAVAVAAEQQQNLAADDGWQIVGNRRRKSTSSTTVSEFDREISIEKELAPTAPLNVYERLSSTTSYRRPSSSNNMSNSATSLTCPRSAMDLPQTKASMAKMAYSRQLLWEKNQQSLVEKLRARQKKEKQSNRGCGFNFADPQAVRRSVEAFNQKRKSGNGEGSEKGSAKNLQSINEHGESSADNLNTTQEEDNIPADPTPSCSSSDVNQKEDKKSLFGYVDGLENDVEWREMTEEEESLALEENSLKLEIKQTEAISIDAELERQVDAEAGKIEKEEKREKKMQKKISKQAKEKDLEYENFRKMFHEIQSLATVAWSEIMQNTSRNVHEPGTPVEKHEKMSSPSRRRCQKDDDDFGKRHEEKLRRAEELRNQLQEEKAARVKELTKRVEEVREKQAKLKERKRQILEERMKRVAENRDKNIMEVIRKAKDDDQRVMEVKFIASLQEDNKRYDLMMKDANMEEKQKQMADERARKMEEKMAKKREQEAAANCRRLKAAEARQIKIKQLTARENEDYSDCLAEMKEIIGEFQKSKSECWKWPDNQKYERPKSCKNCEFQTFSDLDSVAHLFDKHAIRSQEDLKIMFVESEEVVDSFRKNATDEEMLMKSRGFLMKIQISEKLPNTLSSPRNRTRFIRDFIFVFDKMMSTQTRNDPGIQNQVEKSITELVAAIENDQKNEMYINIEQFCAVGGVEKICGAILEWTNRGIGLRLCIRLCHAFCVFLNDSRVAYSVIFKPEMMAILDRIVALIQTNPTNPQLSALLDILHAVLKSANSRISSHSNLKKWKELHCFDEKIKETMENISSFLKSSISRQEWLTAIKESRMIISKISKICENFSENSRFSSEFFEIFLEYSYESRKNSEEKSADLVANVIGICGTSKIWRGNSKQVFVLLVLLEEYLNRVGNLVKIENEKKGKWDLVTKNEECLMKLLRFLEILIDSWNYEKKKILSINWTSENSEILKTLKNLPLRLHCVEPYSTIIQKVFAKILENLKRNQKLELFGDFAFVNQ
ncbi:unnamed protein product [Caenorhabditis angaria]|uniref:S phase cyclin A-associated protein in the endoplasmic reticulum N-terminal domain-containing protein n=1 Tax=Caenorhabditis angaria TaxID=860376 RepID=A0A9P1I4E8_9PELO|nr:unnamed protein product [Caenorhabditis angaria]